MKLTKTIFTILTIFISITSVYSDNYENLLLDKIEILIHAEKFDSASFLMDNFKKSLTVKRVNSNLLRYYNHRILFNRYLNRIDEVKIYTDSVVSIIPEVTPLNGYDSLIVAFGYSNVGNAMFEKNKFNESIEYFENAIRFSPTQAGKNSQAMFYQNVGLNYLHLGQTEKGLENVNKAFSIYERINDMEGKFGCLDYLGNTMVDYRNFELARKFFNMALEIKDSIKNEYQNSSLYNNIGRIITVPLKSKKVL